MHVDNTLTAGSGEFRKFIPFCKVDAVKREVYGIATSETPDKDKERCHYDSTAKLYKEWNAEFEKATDGKSLGNVRAMHQPIAAGKVVGIDFSDEEKRIRIAAKVVDDNEWKKVEEGVYTGFSQGGKYEKRWVDPETGDHWYTAKPTEVSLVDNPCNPDARFEYIKSDGSTEMRKFAKTAEPEEFLPVWHGNDEVEKLYGDPQDGYFFKGGKTKRVAGEDLTSGDFLIVGDKDDPSTWKLPYKFSSEEKTKSHLRNALARFDQMKDVSAEEKAKAKKKLLSLCEEHGIDTSESKKILEGDMGKTAEPDEKDEKHCGDGKCGKCGKCKMKKEEMEEAEKKKAADKAAKSDEHSGGHDKDDIDPESHASGSVEESGAACADAKCGKETCPKCKGHKPGEMIDGNRKIAKGMSTVANLAYMLQSIQYMQASCAAEAATEGDNSPVPAGLKDWLKQGVALLTEMVNEEGKELVEGTETTMQYAAKSEIAKQMFPELVKSQASEAQKEQSQAMLSKIESVMKANDETIQKAVAEAVAPKDVLIKEKEDALTKLTAEKQVVEEQLTKVTGERDTIKAENDQLNKEAVAAADLLKQAEAKIDELMEQEVAPKGVAKSVAVTKEADTGDPAPEEKTPVAGPNGDKNVLKACLSKPEIVR